MPSSKADTSPASDEASNSKAATTDAKPDVAAIHESAPVTPDAKPDAPVEHEITLTQFGIEFSKKEKRVELLNAFIFTERRAAHFKDAKSAYVARFEKFINQPVGECK